MNVAQRVLLERVEPATLAKHRLAEGMATVLVTPRFPTSRHVVALIFPPGSEDPELVVKIPRRSGDNSGVAREAAILQLLGSMEHVHELGIPHVLGLFQDRQYMVLVETAVRGIPLDPSFVQHNFQKALDSGWSFISLLPTTTEPTTGNNWFDEAIDTPLQQFATLLPEELGGEHLVRRTRRFLEPLRYCNGPAVFQHGDLSHPNLFLDASDQLQVIDWERSNSNGPPALDLIFFLEYLAESRRSAYTRPQQMAVFEEIFGGPHGWGWTLLERHLQARCIDPELAPQLIVATWACSAATLVNRLLSDGGWKEKGNLTPLNHRDLMAIVSHDRDVHLWRHSLLCLNVQ